MSFITDSQTALIKISHAAQKCLIAKALALALVMLSLTLSSYRAWSFHFDKSKFTIQLGGTMNTGNTDTTNLSAGIKSEVKHQKISVLQSLSGQLATAKGIESARSLKGSGDINYALSNKAYAFLKGSILYDKFATYDFIIREATGLGRILIENKKHQLMLEAGPGGIHRRISGTTEFQNEPMFNISSKYSWHVSKTAEFKQTFSTDISRQNTSLEASSAISTVVVKNLALEVSFTISHDTNIPPLSKNTRNTDTASKATIVYTF